MYLFIIGGFLSLFIVSCGAVNHKIDMVNDAKNPNDYLIKTLNLQNMNVAIIGGTGGIGRALSRTMASCGANVTVVGQTFRDADLSSIKFIKADLSLMSEAERVGQVLLKCHFDIYILTTGIFSALKRQETKEGIERDLAISYLSRVVILRQIGPKLRENHITRIKPRVFIMGYPGRNHLGHIDDLNSEHSYIFTQAHLNTVAGNEILIFDAIDKYPEAKFFGLNPGIIRTNIRDNLLGSKTLISWFIESVIGFLNEDTSTYATRLVPIITSPNLEPHNGLIFDQKGLIIKPSLGLTQEYINKFIRASEKIVAKSKVSGL